jgi:hypothetical protein
VRSAFSLTEAERARRCDLLIRATTVPEPTRLTEAGLRLLLAAATAPQLPETLPEQLRPQLQRLITAGLVGSDGRLVPEAANVAEVMRRPAIWLQIEAIAGPQPSAWKAWLGDRLAVIAAQPRGADEYTLLTAVPGWVPVAAVQWLDIGPRATPAGHPALPMTTLLRWLDEPDTPLPGDDPLLAKIWAQPAQLWAIEVEPGDGRALVLDAAEAGLWRVSADDADGSAALTPLSPRTFWRLLLTLIARASEAVNVGQSAATTRSDGLL